MLTYDISLKGNLTMYEFLYNCIKDDILSGKIKEGDKLPSKREFASWHQISIKTVENTYEQLMMEGFILSKEKSGYYVQKIDSKSFEIKKRIDYLNLDKEEGELIDFTSNMVSIERFPYSLWAKVMREVMTEKQEKLLEFVPFNGVYELRDEIAKYLYEFRGMSVSPERIVIGAGTEFLYGRIIQLLGRDKVYALEDPGYQKIAKLFKANDLTWEYIKIDGEGLDVKELSNTEAKVVHVSPAHHFPTGVIMPVKRRQELLDWVGEGRDRYIIEDDFDCEFRFDKRPIPTLSNMDKNHRVIYINNFSKTLAPSIRISYMVLPQKLMDMYVNSMNFYSCSVSAFEQYAMAEFMKKGYFERHIRRMKKFYKEKRDRVLEIFSKSKLMERVDIVEYDAGSHFLMRIDTALTDTQIKWYAKEAGVKIELLSEFSKNNKEMYQHNIIINYSDVEEDALKTAVEKLEEVLL